MHIMKTNLISSLVILPLFMLISFGAFSQKNKPQIVNTNRQEVRYFINQSRGTWSIDTSVKVDILRVYCANDSEKVKFITGIDSISFNIKPNDTIRFAFLFKGFKAFTEIVGYNEFPKTISLTDKIANYSILWSEIKYNFVNMDILSLNWDSVYSVYLDKILKTKNDYEYIRILKRFSAILHDGHTAVIDNGDFYPFFDYIPMNLINIDEKVYISNICKGKTLDSSYMGAEIIKVFDIPVKQYLQDSIFPFISASTPQHLWMQAVFKLQSGRKGSKFKATVLKQDNKTEDIVLNYDGETTRSDNDQYFRKIPEYSGQSADFSFLKDSIAYLKSNRFDENAISQINKVIPQINKSRGLIIDFRGNGGGITDVAWYIQSLITKADYFLNFAWQTRVNDGVKRANSNWKEEYISYFRNSALRYEKPDTIYISDTIIKIKVPVVFLIGCYTFSAAEDLLINLYEMPDRPLYIGEPTGGSTGSPLLVPFTFGGCGRICTRRVCFPVSGKPFVNEGIKPDIYLKPNIKEFINNDDVVLEKAKSILFSLDAKKK